MPCFLTIAELKLKNSWEKSERLSKKSINNFTNSICRIIERVRTKNLDSTLLFVHFLQSIWFNTQMKDGLVSLVSLFNGISTLFRLFNVKAILLEEQYYLTHSWEDKGVHTFPKGICPKVNVIARLEYELAYYDSAVHCFNHYTTRTPPWKME